MIKQFDITIVGGGIVGLVMALLLAKDTPLRIALIEENIDSRNKNRVSAFSLASIRIFQYLKLWETIQGKKVNPYHKMHVWDEGSTAKIDFDCFEMNEQALGFIIEDRLVHQTLLEALKTNANISFLHPWKLNKIQHREHGVDLINMNSEQVATKLIIAADGAKSWVRDQTGTVVKIKDYGQTAIVATVTTEFSHQMTAWQRFLSTGPLAFLPLADLKTCSIVWSAQHQYAEKLLTLDDDLFCEELSNAFEKSLGKILHVSRRHSFPLMGRHVKNYIEKGIVYIGDAAHTIHPLAGQGVNIGLLDAASLSEVIAKAVNKNQDFSKHSVLRAYERWRKSENSLMFNGINILNNLFVSKKLTPVRACGLNIINQIPFFKSLLAKYAMGNHSNFLPNSAKKP